MIIAHWLEGGNSTGRAARRRHVQVLVGCVALKPSLLQVPLPRRRNSLDRYMVSFCYQTFPKRNLLRCTLIRNSDTSGTRPNNDQNTATGTPLRHDWDNTGRPLGDRESGTQAEYHRDTTRTPPLKRCHLHGERLAQSEVVSEAQYGLVYRICLERSRGCVLHAGRCRKFFPTPCRGRRWPTLQHPQLIEVLN